MPEAPPTFDEPMSINMGSAVTAAAELLALTPMACCCPWSKNPIPSSPNPSLSAPLKSESSLPSLHMPAVAGFKPDNAPRVFISGLVLIVLIESSRHPIS